MKRNRRAEKSDKNNSNTKQRRSNHQGNEHQRQTTIPTPRKTLMPDKNATEAPAPDRRTIRLTTWVRSSPRNRKQKKTKKKESRKERKKEDRKRQKKKQKRRNENTRTHKTHTKINPSVLILLREQFREEETYGGHKKKPHRTPAPRAVDCKKCKVSRCHCNRCNRTSRTLRLSLFSYFLWAGESTGEG